MTTAMNKAISKDMPKVYSIQPLIAKGSIEAFLVLTNKKLSPQETKSALEKVLNSSEIANYPILIV
jgi:hypothetical protein